MGDNWVKSDLYCLNCGKKKYGIMIMAVIIIRVKLIYVLIVMHNLIYQVSHTM